MGQSDRHLTWQENGGYAKLFGTLLTAIFLPGGIYASGRYPNAPLLLFVPIGGFIGYCVGTGVTWLTMTASGSAAQAFTMPATTGFYANEHSEIMTLEARGDFRGAVSAWDAIAIAEPDNPWPLVRAAELYADKLGDPTTALERYRLARTLPEIKSELKRYTTQKVIDLLLGPMNDKGRALVELRMLIDQWPDSREAVGAREALRNLKAQTPNAI